MTSNLLLDIKGLSKSFPGVAALRDVALEIGHGEVHALLGENGAGKSTLLKTLSGAQKADTGRMLLAGEAYDCASPSEAKARGVVTVYQEFTLIPALSVAENVFVGREPLRYGLIDWRALFSRMDELNGRTGFDLSPSAKVSDLSVAEQQLVEISRALTVDAKLIIMDEPTAALSAVEVTKLFALIRALKASGVSVILVSHRLDEVKEICDRFTVLRDGCVVSTGRVADASVDDLIQRMVGREIVVPHREAKACTGAVVLKTEALSCESSRASADSIDIRDIDFEIRAGEVVGIAGLVGSGRTEFANALFGATPHTSGRILVGGKPCRIRSPRDAIRHGIGLVPEDRKQQGLFLSQAVEANFSISALDDFVSGGLLIGDRERTAYSRYQDKLRIKSANPRQAISNLSGGNQQKVILARWMAMKPKLLIVDEPTRGIDIGAKFEIHQLLRTMAAEGTAVIVISSELAEVMMVSDRIVVMRSGSLSGSVPQHEATEERLVGMMMPRSGAHSPNAHTAAA